MCGLVGFLGVPLKRWEMMPFDRAQDMLRNMADKLIHRGPDGGGYWSDSEQRIGLDHRRLAIVGLSPAGHQPMTSASARYVIRMAQEE